jgi:hypothetical protein
LAKFSESSSQMTNGKFSMTNSQFRLSPLVAAGRDAPWRLCVERSFLNEALPRVSHSVLRASMNPRLVQAGAVRGNPAKGRPGIGGRHHFCFLAPSWPHLALRRERCGWRTRRRLRFRKPSRPGIGTSQFREIFGVPCCTSHIGVFASRL